ncbi:calcium-binding protein [Rhizobium halophytocola]|uniref:Ca2+-binding EF-hand superfamily protein n=1 Tax=Rhizobium halophytocola TaxID=735519 RepID=A0ABS4E063_9HYPH|nr:calcium-binding protein [Rhizobium halophytocola]MBP1851325.1 Ca2+-binding EF-hand superfamily protein [Rhizobium halophytocola]
MFAQKSIITAFSAALLLSASSGMVLAQDAKTPPPPPKPGANDAPCMPPMHAGMMMMHGPAGRFIVALQQFDTNKDGKISKDEAKSAEDALFTAIDADKDGSLTPGEMRKYREARMEAIKAEMSKPSTDDAKAAPPKADDMDSTDDEDQASDDMADAPDEDAMPAPPMPGDDACGPHMRHGGDKMGHHGDRKGHGNKMRHGDRDGRHGDRHHNRHGMGMMHGGMMGGMGMMRRIDTDENGQISKAEADAAVEALFSRHDKNGDGFISADDFPKAPSILPSTK